MLWYPARNQSDTAMKRSSISGCKARPARIRKAATGATQLGSWVNKPLTRVTLADLLGLPAIYELRRPRSCLMPLAPQQNCLYLVTRANSRARTLAAVKSLFGFCHRMRFLPGTDPGGGGCRQNPSCRRQRPRLRASSPAIRRWRARLKGETEQLPCEGRPPGVKGGVFLAERFQPTITIQRGSALLSFCLRARVQLRRSPASMAPSASVASGPSDPLRRSTQVFENRKPGVSSAPGNKPELRGRRGLASPR